MCVMWMVGLFRCLHYMWLLGPILLLTILFGRVCPAICLRSERQSSNFLVPRWLRFFFFIAGCIRYGEALHPGPRDDVVSHDFCIGCFNPSGLAGKAQVINECLSHGDLWLISETHLSTRSLSSFRKSLKITQSPFRYMASGFPVPLRLNSSMSGGWKGVAALSQHPTRAVPVG